MRVLLHHPWGRFDPGCGASHAARAHRDYFRARGWNVHSMMQEVPAWGLTASEGECTVALDCPPVAPGDYGNEFCHLLYASERTAHGRAFRAIANTPWDAFFTTDVCAAPFAHAMPCGTLKVLAVGDSYARRAATTEPASAFGRVEAELYHLFDRVLFASEAGAAAARRRGLHAARYVPAWARDPAAVEVAEEHDLTICGAARGGDRADLEWFYRHVYRPHLRACGVRLTVAGPVGERFATDDVCVAKVPLTPAVYAASRVVVAAAHEAAGPYVSALDAMAAGRAVLATPLALRDIDTEDDAAVCIDMRSDPAGTATALRELLAAPARRQALGARAALVGPRHSRERHFAALDAAWGEPARQARAFVAAAAA